MVSDRANKGDFSNPRGRFKDAPGWCQVIGNVVVGHHSVPSVEYLFPRCVATGEGLILLRSWEFGIKRADESVAYNFRSARFA